MLVMPVAPWPLCGAGRGARKAVAASRSHPRMEVSAAVTALRLGWCGPREAG